ncbi:phage tail protein I [Persephonella sp.]
MLKEIVPPNLLQDENIKALVEAIEPEFEKVEQEIINVLIYPRIDELNEEVLDILAYQFHIEGYDLATDITEKRNLVKKAIELHRYKGTKYAVEKACKALNIKPIIKEWFEYGGQPYYFKVDLSLNNKQITPELRNKLINFINEYRNERSWLDELILSYIAQAQVNIYSGTMAETTAYSEMITGFEWESKGTAFVYSGTMAEVSATTQFVEV